MQGHPRLHLTLLIATLSWSQGLTKSICLIMSATCGCAKLRPSVDDSNALSRIAAMATHETDEFYYIDDMAFRKSSLRMARAAGDPPADSLIDVFWPGGIIFVDIDNAFSSAYKKLIIQTYKAIEKEVTPDHLEFKRIKRKNGTSCRRNYLYIKMTLEKKCEAEIGMQAQRTMVWLNEIICKDGAILHELLHALGRYHEHSRPDRDRYVEIRADEIVQKACQNFCIFLNPFKRPDPTLKLGYDIHSIMHYDSCAFSCSGKPTILHKSPGNYSLIARNREHMTQLDIEKIKLMYPKDAKVPYREEFCPIIDESSPLNKDISAVAYQCSVLSYLLMSIILWIAVHMLH